MAKEASAPPSPLKGGRPPAVKYGSRRASKKQKNGAVEKNPKNPGKEKTSSIVSVTKMQNMGVLLADALEKILQTCSFLQDREEVLRYHNGLVL
ncbi:death-associated protein-like 1 isoform X2 [Caretta caretta]|uniref:death-associated protein-like 1 isoform X2 n=1 Tax=Caretta caretta TaxID=8467 RepID=UPI0020946EAF|nr:death-associated protein-like 1 isoform X2 [Caretta caretta]